MTNNDSETGPTHPRIAPHDMQAVTEARAQAEPDASLDDLAHMAELRVLRSVVDSMGDGLVVLDATGRLVLSNPIARTILGGAFQEVCLDQWQERHRLFRSDKTTPYPHDERPLTRALHGETVYLEDVYLLDRLEERGKWLRVAAHPILDDDGRVQGAFAVFRDVTRRKHAEEDLLLHTRAMASASEGITIVDPGQPAVPIVYANEGFARITGYTRDEIKGKTLCFIQGPATSPEAVAEIASAIREERTCTVELISYRKDGSPFWNRVSVNPVRDDHGLLTHFVGVHTDITQLKETEDRLRAARDELESAYKRMKRNLDAAAEVQRALLPSDLPDFPWGTIAWRFKPCDELAGDILSVFVLDDDHVGAFVLDVCGHGVAAALLSVTVRRFLSPSYGCPSIVVRRKGASRSVDIVPPAQVADQLNRRFAWDADRGQFFTLVYCVLNTRTGHLRYVLAGHPPPLHLSADGDPEPLPGSGFPIGIRTEPYQEHSARLNPGERLLIYSDGASDAMTAGNRIFGEQRLRDAFADGRGESLDASLSLLFNRIEAWCQGAPIRDDISLLAIEMNG